MKDKFGAAGLEPQASELVRPPRARQCPVQMESELVVSHGVMDDIEHWKGFIVVLEVKVLRVHALDSVISKDYENRIDPDKWRPLIMSFQRLYGLSGQRNPSVLAEIDEEKYRITTE